VQADRGADELRREEVALEKLPEDEDPSVARSSAVGQNCTTGDADREDSAGQRADVGDEGQKTRDEPIRTPKFSPDQGEPDGVEGAEDQAYQRLTLARSPRWRRSISRARTAHRVAVAQRHPAVDGRDHAVPIDES
jgi:hypothetical protein